MTDRHDYAVDIAPLVANDERARIACGIEQDTGDTFTLATRAYRAGGGARLRHQAL
jgi:hypothetical protein